MQHRRRHRQQVEEGDRRMIYSTVIWSSWSSTLFFAYRYMVTSAWRFERRKVKSKLLIKYTGIRFIWPLDVVGIDQLKRRQLTSHPEYPTCTVPRRIFISSVNKLPWLVRFVLPRISTGCCGWTTGAGTFMTVGAGRSGSKGRGWLLSNQLNYAPERGKENNKLFYEIFMFFT